MASGPCTFRQLDVTRALRAAVAAGIEVQRIEIHKDGKIVLVTSKLSEQAEPAPKSIPSDQIVL
jgi:hypothetical protein